MWLINNVTGVEFLQRHTDKLWCSGVYCTRYPCLNMHDPQPHYNRQHVRQWRVFLVVALSGTRIKNAAFCPKDLPTRDLYNFKDCVSGCNFVPNCLKQQKLILDPSVIVVGFVWQAFSIYMYLHTHILFTLFLVVSK